MRSALLGARHLCQGIALLGLSGALMHPKQGGLLRAPLRTAVSWALMPCPTA